MSNSHRSTEWRGRTVSNDDSKENTPLLHPPVRRASDGSLPIPPRTMRSYSAEIFNHGNNSEVEDLNSGFESDTMLTTSQRKSARFLGPRSLEMPTFFHRGLPSVDEFRDPNPRQLNSNKVNPAHGFHAAAAANKAIRSSRVRKKIAARSKGGEFQARRRKRRLYFCCIAGEIDVEKMADRFNTPYLGLKGRMYDEVLHLYMADTDSLSIPKEEIAWILNNPSLQHQASSYEQENTRHFMEQLGVHTIVEANDSAGSFDEKKSQRREFLRTHRHPSHRHTDDDTTFDENTDNEEIRYAATVTSPLHATAATTTIATGAGTGGALRTALPSLLGPPPRTASFDDSYEPTPRHSGKGGGGGGGGGGVGLGMGLDDHGEYLDAPEHIDEEALLSSAVFWNYGGKEIFVFDFGAMVFWGYQDHEVQRILELAKEYIVKGKLSEIEFEAGEDDMAFVTSYEAESITIANDVIVLPDRVSVKSRLAVSFAIAQSSVLSIFEARIEQKIEDYKYIPDTLAKSGKVALTPKELGNMIGEVFVIRHDVNLHSEILDIPDFFWKENSIEPLYRMTASYLEMEPRTEVLNKRLDLLRELLRLLQHQHETSHGVTLEWIVIWLIVVSVVLELMLWVGEVIGVDLG